MNRFGAIGAFLVFAVAAGHPARAELPATAHPVAVRLAQTTSPESARLLAASLAPVHRATVSTRMAATVQKVLVAEGSVVKRGQLLVVLSADDVRAQLAAATTALSNASAYERRIAELAAGRAATPVELEGAQAQRSQAAAAVAAARANLAYTQLRAPFTGIVQARRVNAGDFVGPGQPLVEMEGSDLELQATLSEDEAAGLHIGQHLPFQSNGQHGEAELTALTTGGDALAHRRTLRAKIVTGAADLRSGAFARIEVPGSARSQQPRVPKTALVQRGDLTGVFVAENGRALLRWLAVGEASGPDVSIRAGLAGNEAVIDEPGTLTDEQPVEIVNGR
jgi:membrane fusion protein, multidrug efflux system